MASVEDFRSPLVGLGEKIGQNKLALAMESKRIEHQLALEQQAKMAEQAQTQRLQSVSPAQMGIFAGLGGKTIPPDLLSQLGSPELGGNIPSHIAGTALGMIGKEGSGGGEDIKQVVNPDGSTSLYRINKKNGRAEAVKGVGGVTTAASNDIIKAKSAHQEINGILNSIDKLSGELVTASGASGLPEQAARNKINQFLQSDSGAAKTYKDTLQGHAQRYEKLITGNGRMAAEMVHGAMKGFPDILGDSQATRSRKMQTLKNLNDNMLYGTLSAHGQKIPEGSMALPQETSSNPVMDAVTAELQRRGVQ